jgi:hypothetical protein
MRKASIGTLTVIGLCLMSSATGYCASWVQSQNQGLSVRHPQGWRVTWPGAGFVVADPQNQMIWCEVRTEKGSGTSQQFTYAMLDRLSPNVQDLRVLTERQFDRRPDVFGIKLSYRSNGVPIGSVILTATADGREFTTRSYAAPAQAYDQAKLYLIPILLSYSRQGEDSSGGPTGNMPVIQSPHGFWTFKAPRGWRIVDSGDEAFNAVIEGPEGTLGVRFNSGLLMKQQLTKHIPYPQPDPNLRNRPPGTVDIYGEGIKISKQYEQMTSMPYLPAADLVQHLILPIYQQAAPDVKVLDWKPVSPEQVRFSVTFTDPVKRVMAYEEAVVINSSLPHPPGYSFTPDFNLHTVYFVNAPPQNFPKVRNMLWQILNTFEPSSTFGAPIYQRIAVMRKQNSETIRDNALRNLQTNQNMMRDTVGTTIRMGEQRRQEGEAWIRMFSGTEIARDPATGKRYEVPVGGQHIYGSDVSGRVIRSDRPLSPDELPSGFQQLESVGLYR